MKIVGPRQSPVSSSSAPKSSEPASDVKVGSSVLRDIRLGEHRRHDASGSSVRTGGSHSDNCQTVCNRHKKDGFEPPGMVKVQSVRGGIGTGRGSDNVLLSDDSRNGDRFSPKPSPGPWTQPTFEFPAPPQKPIRSIGDLLRRLFEGLQPKPAPVPGNPLEGGPGLNPGDKGQGKWSPIRIGGSHADNISKGDSGDKDRMSGGSFAPPSKPRSRLEQLLERLFPRGFPGRGQVMGRVDKPGLTHANNVLMHFSPERDRNVLMASNPGRDRNIL